MPHRLAHSTGISQEGDWRDSADYRRRLWHNMARNRWEGRAMSDTQPLPRRVLDVKDLTAEAFAPYGEVIAPLRTGG